MVKLDKDKFNEHIFTRINNLIRDYELIKEGELIAVALSGGKDSVLTLHALKNYQQFLDFFPNSVLYESAQDRLFELQDKLVMKELLSAQLYYNLGGYFGNISSSTESNYSSCIIVAQNALKNYPYTKWREDFATLIMKSKFELAENSTEDKKLERYRDAEDECYGFINEYPESKDRSTAEKYITKCKKVVND